MSETFECSDDVGGVDINQLSIAFSIGYGLLMLIIFLAVSIKGYSDVKAGLDRGRSIMFLRYDLDIDDEQYNEDDLKGGKKAGSKESVTGEKKKGCWHYFKRWAMYTWTIRSMYAAAAVHIYDISTDIGVMLEWWLLSYQQRNKDNWALKEVYAELDMTVLFVAALVAFNIYRIISSFLLYMYTKKIARFFSQFFDLEIFRIIYINHQLHRTEPGNLHRFLSKIEAIFESSPQSVLQVVFLIKTINVGTSSGGLTNTGTAEVNGCEYEAFSPLVFASLIFSIVSVAGRFIADDKVFFDEKRAQSLGFGFDEKKCGGWGLTWNWGYVVRYLWRLSDVIARVMILSFIWIVFGGEVCGILFGLEATVMVLVITCSNEEVGYDFLQFLFTTYIVGKNFKNGFCKLNDVMKWSLLFRMFENVAELLIVTIFLFNTSLLDSCQDTIGTCPPTDYLETVMFDQPFGISCFIVAWVTTVLYIVLFFLIMHMELWREVLKINKDRDISKCAYGIEKQNWIEGTFNINADRDVIKTALRGDLLTVKEMLAFGYDINGVDKDGRNLIHHLCFNQKTDKATMDFIMLDCNCKSIVNNCGTKLGQAPIHYYIWANSDLGNDGPGQIDHFIDKYGADPQIRDFDDNTLLHFSSRNRHAFNNLEMVAHLCEKYDMDMNRKNKLDQTPFMFYLKWNKHAKLLYFCQFKKIYNLDFDIVDKEGYTILHWAVSNWKGKCKADIVEFVLNNGGQKYIHAKTNDGKSVKDVLNGLDEDMEENTDAEKQARQEWLTQRDLILKLLEDFDPENGTREPQANVDEVVERELAKQDELERKEAMENQKKSVPVDVKVEIEEEEEVEEEDDKLAPTIEHDAGQKSTEMMIELGQNQPSHVVASSEEVP